MNTQTGRERTLGSRCIDARPAAGSAASPAIDSPAGGYGAVGVATEDAMRDWVMSLTSPTLVPSAPRPHDSMQWLLGVLRAAQNDVLPLIAFPWLRSATTLFSAVVKLERREERQRVALPCLLDYFRVLARPFDAIEHMTLCPGDVLVRVALGQAHSHLAVVASRHVAWHHELALRNWSGEGYPAVKPGVYVHVVEPLPYPRAAAECFARRIADGQRCLLGDTLLLRPMALQRQADALGVLRPESRVGAIANTSRAGSVARLHDGFTLAERLVVKTWV